MIEGSVNWVLFAPSDMCVVDSAGFTSPDFVPRARRAPMRIRGGRRTYPDRRCALRRLRRSWSMSEHSFERSKSGRRNESANGGMSVDVAAASCAAAIAAEEGGDTSL
jgi:hypothetical protein